MRRSYSSIRNKLKTRGGFVPRRMVTPSRMTAAKKVWSKIKPMVPSMASRLGVSPALLPLVINVGDHLVNTLKGPKGPNKMGPVKPKGGFEVNNDSSGIITETEFMSQTGKRKVPDFYKAARRIDFVTNNSFRFTSLAQSQQPIDMSGIGSSDTIDGYFYNNCIWGGTFTGATSTNNGALQTITNLMPNPSVTSRVYYSNCMCKTMLTNFTNTPVLVDIYELAASTDIGQANTNLQGNQLQSPAEFWRIGMSTMPGGYNIVPNAGAGGNATYTNLGVYPTQSQLFNCYWTICAKLTVNLTAGSTHVHNSMYYLDKSVDAYRYNFSAILSGITRNIMFVVRGVPAQNATDNSVVIGPAGLLVNQEIVYKSYQIDTTVRQIYYADAELNVAGGDNVISPSDSSIQSETVDPTI